jgi:hypothetical protein
MILGARIRFALLMLSRLSDIYSPVWCGGLGCPVDELIHGRSRPAALIANPNTPNQSDVVGPDATLGRWTVLQMPAQGRQRDSENLAQLPVGHQFAVSCFLHIYFHDIQDALTAFRRKGLETLDCLGRFEVLLHTVLPPVVGGCLCHGNIYMRYINFAQAKNQQKLK